MKRKGKILREWYETERWSAYDTDIFYYVKVSDPEGNIYTLKDMNKEKVYNNARNIIRGLNQ